MLAGTPRITGGNSGGGTIIGTIGTNQIAFGDATNSIAGSASFIYVPAGHIFAVGFGSDFVLNFHGLGAGNTYDFGDLDGLSTGITFTMDELTIGSTWSAVIGDNNGKYFSVNQDQNLYQLGDINGVNHASYLSIDDTAQTTTVHSSNGLIVSNLSGGGNQGVGVDNTGKLVASNQTILNSRTTILSTDVLTLNSIPVQIAPAPAVGLAIIPISITVKLVFNTTAYAVNTTLVAYTSLVAGGYMNDVLSLQDGTSTIRTMLLSNQNQVATGVPLMLTVSGGNPALGDSNIVVDVNYMIMLP